MTEHEKLVEQVARVICFETGSMGDPMPIEMQRVDRDWKEHITAAKAAIFAVHATLQEPSEEMLEAGACYEWRDEGYNQECLDNITAEGSISVDVWQAMLDASPLKEKI